MTLKTLISSLPGARFLREGNPEITGLSTDSRQVKPGDLFIAIRGGQLKDRHAFIPQAVAAGAAATVVEDPVEAGSAAVVQVPNTRQAIGILADRFYGAPSRALRMVGVTGTNGKTTTTMLIQAILIAAGWPAGLIGTIEYRLGNRTLPAAIGTPEAHDLQRMLREMVESQCRAAVMETTSHGQA